MVIEEIGRAVAPVPFLTSAVLATVALLAGGTQTLRSLAAGDDRGADVPLSTPPGACPATVGRCAGPDRPGHASRRRAADVLVVPAAGPDGLELHVVRAAAGMKVTPVPSLDMTRPIADVQFPAVASTRVDNGAPRTPWRRRCWPAPCCWPPSSSAWRVVSGDDTRLRQGAPPVRPGRRLVPGAQAPAGRPVGGGRSAGATARYAADTYAAATRTPRSRPPSRRRTAAMSPCTPPRSASSCTAASA